MVYPSRPDSPTTSGWLQMMVTEVSFLSSINRSSGALVGSARCHENIQFCKGAQNAKKKQTLKSEINARGFLRGGDTVLYSNTRQNKTEQESRTTTLWDLFLNGGLPLGGGGGGVGGLGSSGAGASAPSAGVKHAFALLSLAACDEQSDNTASNKIQLCTSQLSVSLTGRPIGFTVIMVFIQFV